MVAVLIVCILVFGLDEIWSSQQPAVSENQTAIEGNVKTEISKLLSNFPTQERKDNIITELHSESENSLSSISNFLLNNPGAIPGGAIETEAGLVDNLIQSRHDDDATKLSQSQQKYVINSPNSGKWIVNEHTHDDNGIETIEHSLKLTKPRKESDTQNEILQKTGDNLISSKKRKRKYGNTNDKEDINRIGQLQYTGGNPLHAIKVISEQRSVKIPPSKATHINLFNLIKHHTNKEKSRKVNLLKRFPIDNEKTEKAVDISAGLKYKDSSKHQHVVRESTKKRHLVSKVSNPSDMVIESTKLRPVVSESTTKRHVKGNSSSSVVSDPKNKQNKHRESSYQPTVFSKKQHKAIESVTQPSGDSKSSTPSHMVNDPIIKPADVSESMKHHRLVSNLSQVRPVVTKAIKELLTVVKTTTPQPVTKDSGIHLNIVSESSEQLPMERSSTKQQHVNEVNIRQSSSQFEPSNSHLQQTVDFITTTPQPVITKSNKPQSVINQLNKHGHTVTETSRQGPLVIETSQQQLIANDSRKQQHAVNSLSKHVPVVDVSIRRQYENDIHTTQAVLIEAANEQPLFSESNNKLNVIRKSAEQRSIVNKSTTKHLSLVSKSTKKLPTLVSESTKLRSAEVNESVKVPPSAVFDYPKKLSHVTSKSYKLRSSVFKNSTKLRSDPSESIKQQSTDVSESTKKKPLIVTESNKQLSKVTELNKQLPEVSESHKQLKNVSESNKELPKVSDSKKHKLLFSESNKQLPNVNESIKKLPIDSESKRQIMSGSGQKRHLDSITQNKLASDVRNFSHNTIRQNSTNSKGTRKVNSSKISKPSKRSRKRYMEKSRNDNLDNNDRDASLSTSRRKHRGRKTNRSEKNSNEQRRKKQKEMSKHRNKYIKGSSVSKDTQFIKDKNDSGKSDSYTLSLLTMENNDTRSKTNMSTGKEIKTILTEEKSTDLFKLKPNHKTGKAKQNIVELKAQQPLGILSEHNLNSSDITHVNDSRNSKTSMFLNERFENELSEQYGNVKLTHFNGSKGENHSHDVVNVNQTRMKAIFLNRTNLDVSKHSNPDNRDQHDDWILTSKTSQNTLNVTNGDVETSTPLYDLTTTPYENVNSSNDLTHSVASNETHEMSGSSNKTNSESAETNGIDKYNTSFLNERFENELSEQYGNVKLTHFNGSKRYTYNSGSNSFKSNDSSITNQNDTSMLNIHNGGNVVALQSILLTGEGNELNHSDPTISTTHDKRKYSKQNSRPVITKHNKTKSGDHHSNQLPTDVNIVSGIEKTDHDLFENDLFGNDEPNVKVNVRENKNKSPGMSKEPAVPLKTMSTGPDISSLLTPNDQTAAPAFTFPEKTTTISPNETTQSNQFEVTTLQTTLSLPVDRVIPDGISSLDNEARMTVSHNDSYNVKKTLAENTEFMQDETADNMIHYNNNGTDPGYKSDISSIRKHDSNEGTSTDARKHDHSHSSDSHDRVDKNIQNIADLTTTSNILLQPIRTDLFSLPGDYDNGHLIYPASHDRLGKLAPSRTTSNIGPKKTITFRQPASKKLNGTHSNHTHNELINPNNQSKNLDSNSTDSTAKWDIIFNKKISIIRPKINRTISNGAKDPWQQMFGALSENVTNSSSVDSSWSTNANNDSIYEEVMNDPTIYETSDYNNENYTISSLPFERLSELNSKGKKADSKHFSSIEEQPIVKDTNRNMLDGTNNLDYHETALLESTKNSKNLDYYQMLDKSEVIADSNMRNSSKIIIPTSKTSNDLIFKWNRLIKQFRKRNLHNDTQLVDFLKKTSDDKNPEINQILPPNSKLSDKSENVIPPTVEWLGLNNENIKGNMKIVPITPDMSHGHMTHDHSSHDHSTHSHSSQNHSPHDQSLQNHSPHGHSSLGHVSRTKNHKFFQLEKSNDNKCENDQNYKLALEVLKTILMNMDKVKPAPIRQTPKRKYLLIPLGPEPASQSTRLTSAKEYIDGNSHFPGQNNMRSQYSQHHVPYRVQRRNPPMFVPDQSSFQ